MQRLLVLGAACLLLSGCLAPPLLKANPLTPSPPAPAPRAEANESEGGQVSLPEPAPPHRAPAPPAYFQPPTRPDHVPQWLLYEMMRMRTEVEILRNKKEE